MLDQLVVILVLESVAHSATFTSGRAVEVDRVSRHQVSHTCSTRPKSFTKRGCGGGAVAAAVASFFGRSSIAAVTDGSNLTLDLSDVIGRE